MAPFDPWKHCHQRSLRVAALAAAFLVYGLCGFPTPPAFGPAEAVVGLLLLFAAGAPGIRAAFFFRPAVFWAITAQGLLFYGLTVPLLGGLLNGADPYLMLRDVIPFFFLLLPLFLSPLAVRMDVAQKRNITLFVALSGCCFAARVVLPWLRHDGGGWHPALPVDPAYLANAPTVLFAALLLLGFGAGQILTGLSPKRLLSAGAAGIAALLPVTATMLVTQRASAGALAVFIVGGLMVSVTIAPRRALPLLSVIALLLLWQADLVLRVAGDMLTKTREVGVNMRWQEALAVARTLGPSPLGVLFGRGWGATVASPAVGGLTVNYTHSFLTTYWLKTGLCGLSLALAYLAGLARQLLRFPRRQALLAAALALPLLIDVTLYASFKSLDFGLLLFLIALWAPPGPSALRMAAGHSKSWAAHA